MECLEMISMATILIDYILNVIEINSNAFIYFSPTIWSITKLIHHISNVGFYFDFHAHPSRKGFFIYGNAFEEFTQQVEAEIFGKMIELNCPYFENLDCIYSEKQMNSKDKNDHYTK
eukprot:GHVR01121976.1.p1 GENE.GHVR01121976.1~~GHVR01121976.1.p1  ORF type:complete len:117 (-),score=6.03 GHVR01121976.1:2071-2421(-)